MGTPHATPVFASPRASTSPFWTTTIAGTPKIDRQVRAFRESSPAVSAVYVGQRFVDDRGETTQLRTPSASGDVTEAVLRGATLGPFSTLMVRADVIEAVGFPDERFPA